MLFSYLNSFSLIFSFLLLLLILLINVNIINSISISKVNCPSSDYSPLEILSHATPKGIGTVGKFTKLTQKKTLVACTQACCQSSTCNVVFLANSTCFHITCHSMQLCEPVKRTGTKFNKSYMVFVRNVPDNNDAIEFATDYLENNDDDRGDEYQDPILDPKQRRENRVNDLLQDYLSSADTERTSIENDFICSTGMNDCPENEYCQKSGNTRKRQGVCVCVKGWARDDQKVCQPLAKKDTDEVLSDESQERTETTMISNITGGGMGSGVPVTLEPSASTHLVVSAGPNQVIQLPEDETSISAFVLPSSKSYKYEWQLIAKPSPEEVGNMEGSNTDHIKLSHLKAGNYTFKVLVTDRSLKGSTEVNVTVLPPKRVNKPPVAVIQPANSTVQLPNKDTVLDGSFSTDDNNNKIVKYDWQAMTVPIGYTNIKLASSPTLQLKDLLPGLYQLKLTVTDSDGAINSTIANVTVLKEIDYPPTANAGQDQIIFQPQNEITLMGNQSTDDKSIVTWQWTRAPDENNGKLSAVDMDGTSTPFLHLSKLEVGVYKFVLKVTDTSNQSSTAEVHVFVKPENNQPPVAITTKDIKVVLPLENPLILDGSQSHDDSGVKRWLWEQISGPKQLQILNSNESKANLTNKLIPGEYEFRLTIWDSKESNSSSTVKVSVIQEKNLPPKVNAGGDKTVTLPVSEVVLNGSQSYDDVEIVSYVWERTAESLAFGDVIDNSSYTPVLRLTNLIVGRYLFKLTVTDSQGSTTSEVASLIVKPAADMSDQIELILNSDVRSFTSDQELTVLKRLELLINDGQPIKVQLIKLDATTHTRRVIILFTVLNANTNKCISGPKVVKQLKQKLKTDSSLIIPEVLSIETLVCQNECSNHGSCDQYTKRCLCEAFWMEDLIRLHFGDRESNCDWSVLYVIVISFIVVIIMTALFWTCVCCISHLKAKRPTLKTRKYRKSNRNRYTLLEDDYEMTGADRMELLSNNVKELNSKTLMSDSSDSLSDTLFDMNSTNNILKNNLNSNSNQHQKRHQKSLNGLIVGKDNRKVRT